MTMVAAASAEPAGTSAAGQSIADALCAATSAPIAFVPDGVLNSTGKKDDLSTWIQFPAESVSVVRLTGKQIRSALERSVSLFPSSNPSFLQVSGIDVVFDKDKSPDKRVVSATVLGAALEDAKSYEVAMPTSLAKGGLGYFMIWEKTAVVRTLPKTTMGGLCAGKPVLDSDARWKQAG